jgi:hypothetical protein
MNKVYVVMCNDFPHRVFECPIEAKRYCELQQGQQDFERDKGLRMTKRYWRTYQMPLVPKGASLP